MSGSVFQRPPGSGIWYYRIPAKDPKTGKYVQIWKGGFESRKEALAEKSKAEVRRDEGFRVSPSKITVQGWIEKWLADREPPELEASTHKEYSRILRTYVIPNIGKMKLKDLKRTDFHELYRTVRRGGVKNQNIARTALAVHQVLRSCLKAAVLDEYLQRNPSDGVTAPKVDKVEPEMPPKDVILQLLADSEGTRIGTIVQLVAWSGLREGEVVRLKWLDIDLGRKTLRVKEAKHDSTGTIPLSAETASRLIAWKLKQADLMKAARPAWKDEGFVFCKDDGSELTTHIIRHDWERLRVKYGLTHLKFHHLRHLYASLLIDMGMHPRAIQKNMRHKDFSTTMNVYGHLMADAEASAPFLDGMDEMIRSFAARNSAGDF